MVVHLRSDCEPLVMGKTNHFEGTFTYFNASSEDQPDFPINQYFDAAADFIEEARKMGGKILVHCAGEDS